MINLVSGALIRTHNLLVMGVSSHNHQTFLLQLSIKLFGIIIFRLSNLLALVRFSLFFHYAIKTIHKTTAKPQPICPSIQKVSTYLQHITSLLDLSHDRMAIYCCCFVVRLPTYLPTYGQIISIYDVLKCRSFVFRAYR